jgi:predicted permease
VLLIAAANVAGLLISRSAARQAEFGVRSAIGASRGRLFRQGLAESAVLTVAGTLIGLLLARWLMDLLLTSLAGTGYPVRAVLNLRVLIVAVGATAAVTLLFGIAPAFVLRDTRLTGELRASRSPTRMPGRLTLQPFVVIQLAACVLLLVGANLFARTSINLERHPLGFDKERVTLVRLSPRLTGHTPETAIALYRRLYDRMNALPGVRQATLARYSPLSGSSSHHSGAVEGYLTADDEPLQLEEVPIGPGYPQVLGMGLVEGRAIGVEDTAGRPKVGMVNRAFVRRYVASGRALGKRFGVSGRQGKSGTTDIEIVGVLDDAQFHDAREAVEPMVFTALWQNTTQSALDVELEIRTDGAVALPASTIRQAIADVDPNLTVSEPRTLASQVSSRLNGPRVTGRLVEVFGALSLLLAAVGIYGVIAQSVARRRQELGIRLALGMPRARIRLMFLGEMGVLLCIGLGLGIIAALAGGRLVASELYGLQPTDPSSLTTAIVLLTIVVLIAGLVPADRATRVDPLRVLRQS